MGLMTEPTVMQLKPSSTKISTPISTVASCAPTLLCMCFFAQRPKASADPDLFIRTTSPPSMVTNTSIPACEMSVRFTTRPPASEYSRVL